MTTRDHTNLGRAALGRAARLALLAGLAPALAAGGCGGETESETAVRDAAIVLTTGDGSGENAESMSEFRQARYTQAANGLSAHVGDDGFGSAAAVLSGLAHQGLGAEAFGKLVIDLGEVQRRLTVLRGSAGAWRTHRALSEAASTYDPQPRITSLDQLDATLRSDLEQAQRVSKLVNDQIAEFESRIAQAEASAAGERNVAGELQLESSTKPAAEAALMAERIREHTRRADRFEFEAQRVRTRADQLRPDAAEKSAHIERIGAQLALVEEARRGVATRTQASNRHHAEALQSAAQTRGDIVEQLDALERYIAGELETARSLTARELREASSAASRAGQATQDSASLVRASSAQRLGELHESVAAMHASVAAALEHMIEIGLDEDGAMARLAQTHRQSEADARDEATDAYADAAAALRRVRVRGETKDRLNELADRLEGIEPDPSPEDFGAEPDDGTGDEFTDEMSTDEGEGFPEDNTPEDEAP